MELPGGGDDEILILRRSAYGLGLRSCDRTIGLVDVEHWIIVAKNRSDDANTSTHSGCAMHEHIADTLPTRHEREAKVQSTGEFAFTQAPVGNWQVQPFRAGADRTEQCLPVERHWTQRNYAGEWFSASCWMNRCRRAEQSLFAGPVVAEIEASSDGPHEGLI